MQVTRFTTAKPYEVAKHFGMTAMRLQGGDTTNCKDFWVGYSTFLPGGGAEWDAGATGKVYVILEGTVSVKTDTEEVDLGPMDSVFIPPNESRYVLNKTNSAATMLVIAK